MTDSKSTASRIHLACIATEPEVIKRVTDLATEFEYRLHVSKDVDSYATELEEVQVVMTVFSAANVTNPRDIAGSVQVFKQFSPDSFIVVIIEKRMSADQVLFVKKSGANLILTEDAFLNTSQLEYIASQIIRGSLIPIKGVELHANTNLTFDVLCIMPLNKKILPVAFRNNEVSDNKLKKLHAATELFIKRDDLSNFRQYVDTYADKSAEGINARCRLKYLEMCRAHANLIFLLIDQSEAASYDLGKQLLGECLRFSQELMAVMATVENPWSIVSNSTIGESGSAERSCSFGALAGVLSLSMTGVTTDDIVMGGILADIGLLDMPPDVLKLIRVGKMSELNKDQLNIYQQHPILSVNRCLTRKLPVPENLKAIVMATHEQADGKGFPKQLPNIKIPKEAYVINFCQLVDDALIIKFGEKRREVRDVQNEILARETAEMRLFTIGILHQLKEVLGF